MGKRAGKEGYDALVFIDKGDQLTIWNEKREIVFDGEIDPDFISGWREYPLNPGYGQPNAGGYWIHWTQKGWTPEDWAKLFFSYNPPLRAKPVKSEYHHPYPGPTLHRPGSLDIEIE